MSALALVKEPEYPVSLVCALLEVPRASLYRAKQVAILDAYSRKVVGWSISLNIDAALALSALHRAVEAAGGQPSMSSKARPYDNARAESFFASLKK